MLPDFDREQFSDNLNQYLFVTHVDFVDDTSVSLQHKRVSFKESVYYTYYSMINQSLWSIVNFYDGLEETENCLVDLRWR